METMHWIRKTYGVPAKRGCRVKYHQPGQHPKHGVIQSQKDGYLKIKFDGDKKTYPANFHSVWWLTYNPIEFPLGGIVRKENPLVQDNKFPVVDAGEFIIPGHIKTVSGLWDETASNIWSETAKQLVSVDFSQAINALKEATKSLQGLKVELKVWKRRQRRRYYLHSKAKKFSRVDARNYLVFITQSKHDALPNKSLLILQELTSFWYSVQLEIPD